VSGLELSKTVSTTEYGVLVMRGKVSETVPCESFAEAWELLDQLRVDEPDIIVDFVSRRVEKSRWGMVNIPGVSS
jgi:hypothetical protein